MKPLRICRRRAFTFVELMVAMVVTLLLVGLLASIADSTTKAWRQGTDKTETFAGTRSALSLIGRELQGAVIDLDLGYTIQSNERNDYVLKLLTRRTPTADDPSSIQKVAYQLAWASRGLLPTLSATRDGDHPLSVLIRTVNSTDDGLQNVFNVTGANKPWTWAQDWDPLVAPQPGDTTEVLAENVLGWEVNPVYFDASDKKVVVDRTDSTSSTASITYVDRGPQDSPRYITSDLKYVKKIAGMESVTASSAPRAIEIRLAVVPSSILPRLTQESALENVRDEPALFKPETLAGGSSLNLMLKQHLRVLDGTYYLSSKTP